MSTQIDRFAFSLLALRAAYGSLCERIPENKAEDKSASELIKLCRGIVADFGYLEERGTEQEAAQNLADRWG